MSYSDHPVDGNEILYLLAERRHHLASFGVIGIGVVEPRQMLSSLSTDREISVIVYLQVGKRNFADFMSLVSYLQEEIGRDVNVIVGRTKDIARERYSHHQVRYLPIGDSH